MSLRRVGALVSVAAFGLICALGAGGASGITPAPGTRAYDRLANQYCKCKIPERYRFRIGGTTNFYVGGTETWTMRGVLRRHRRRVPFTRVSYWQARGTLTTTWTNVGVGYDSRCTDPESGIFNASQTLKLRRNDVDVEVGFRLVGRKYNVDTGPGYLDYPTGRIRGTVRCGDGATFPANVYHKSTEHIRHGRPLGVVRGKAGYQEVELDRIRFHWRLKAIR